MCARRNAPHGCVTYVCCVYVWYMAVDRLVEAVYVCHIFCIPFQFCEHRSTHNVLTYVLRFLSTILVWCFTLCNMPWIKHIMWRTFGCVLYAVCCAVCVCVWQSLCLLARSLYSNNSRYGYGLIWNRLVVFVLLICICHERRKTTVIASRFSI